MCPTTPCGGQRTNVRGQFFSYVGHEDQTQVVKLDGLCFYPMSHLASQRKCWILEKNHKRVQIHHIGAECGNLGFACVQAMFLATICGELLMLNIFFRLVGL